MYGKNAHAAYRDLIVWYISGDKESVSSHQVALRLEAKSRDVSLRQSPSIVVISVSHTEERSTLTLFIFMPHRTVTDVNVPLSGVPLAKISWICKARLSLSLVLN